MHTLTQTCFNRHAHTLTHVHTKVHKHPYTLNMHIQIAHTYTCIHTDKHAHTQTHTHKKPHTYTGKHTHMCTHTHTHTHTHSAGKNTTLLSSRLKALSCPQVVSPLPHSANLREARPPSGSSTRSCHQTPGDLELTFLRPGCPALGGKDSPGTPGAH